MYHITSHTLFTFFLQKNVNNVTTLTSIYASKDCTFYIFLQKMWYIHKWMLKEEMHFFGKTSPYHIAYTL